MSNALIKTHLESAIKSNSHFSQAHYELAKIFLEEQNIKSAIKSLKNAINSGLEKSLASEPLTKRIARSSKIKTFFFILN